MDVVSTVFQGLLNHSPAEGYLGCPWFGAIMNMAAVNNCVQAFV